LLINVLSWAGDETTLEKATQDSNNYDRHNILFKDYGSRSTIISSSQDRFGRRHFADRIANVIASRESTSGLVVGIHGPWGEGKTSVLNMIVERLETFENVVVVRFNPWRFPEESLLLRSFFLDVAGKIDSALLTKKERMVALAEEYADMLSAIPYAGKMSGAFKVFARKRSHGDIDALKTRFENALAKSSKRIVVMMDDIDRLDKAEIYTVFRLVKLLGDFPNTTYVLFFDEKRVAEALGEKYVGVGGGKSFLEKIIQVPLSLPPASRHARRALAIEGLDGALTLANYKLTGSIARSASHQKEHRKYLNMTTNGRWKSSLATYNRGQQSGPLILSTSQPARRAPITFRRGYTLTTSVSPNRQTFSWISQKSSARDSLSSISGSFRTNIGKREKKNWTTINSLQSGQCKKRSA